MNLQNLDWNTILVDVGMLAFLVLAVVVVVKLLAKPIKALLKFLIHAATGILLFYGKKHGFLAEWGFTRSTAAPRKMLYYLPMLLACLLGCFELDCLARARDGVELLSCLAVLDGERGRAYDYEIREGIGVLKELLGAKP